jgi:triacylglycerol lipase
MLSATQLLTGLSLGLLTLVESRACNSTGRPTVTVKNGTYYGVHNPDFNQDFFLGMPFAKVSEAST